ncbi:hypothetical protein DGG96_08375 [Legionella qingyii]|uniref:Uncharacterized protein n=1 Tax=Legionella qingyii TaxID=2184757 RepID=A0A317U433_9GAMM|nr:hypothetical protein DGG96_08375 [Legionella qingyii]
MAGVLEGDGLFRDYSVPEKELLVGQKARWVAIGYVETLLSKALVQRVEENVHVVDIKTVVNENVSDLKDSPLVT